jgi:hypothetical protein
MSGFISDFLLAIYDALAIINGRLIAATWLIGNGQCIANSSPLITNGAYHVR